MKNENMASELQAQNLALNKRVVELENTVVELSALVKYFEEHFKLSQLKRFGTSSEKTFPGVDQMSLFGESETVKPTAAEEPKSEAINYTRRKRVGKRDEDLAALPLEIIEYDIPEEERACPQCGVTMQEIGVDTRDEIKIVPPQSLSSIFLTIAQRRPI